MSAAPGTSVGAARNRLPTSVVTGARALLGKLTASSSTPLLPFIPKPVKVLLLILFLLHSPSWPFTWHVRVWYSAIKAYYLAYSKGRSKYLVDWQATNSAKGGIKGLRARMTRVAWLDDCDFNLHLSNSAYAKNSDAIKMDWCIQAMSPVYTPGAHMALGATHYTFFKEIPLGMEYTMEARCGGWDEKWMYVAIEFIIYPKKGKGKGKSKSSTIKDKAVATTTSLAEKASESTRPTIVPSISDPPTRTGSPAPSTATAELKIPTTIAASSSGTSTPSGQGSKTEEIKRAWAKKREEQPRADGGVVCCLSVSEYCFKMGRMTIPPRIALWLALQSPTKDEKDRARKLVMSKDAGRAFLRGGWRDEPDAETLGKDIGLSDADNDGLDWVSTGKEGMEKVVEGMSVF